MARSDTAPDSIHFIFNGVIWYYLHRKPECCDGNAAAASLLCARPLLSTSPSGGPAALNRRYASLHLVIWTQPTWDKIQRTQLEFARYLYERPPPVRRNQPQRLIRHRDDQVADVLKQLLLGPFCYGTKFFANHTYVDVVGTRSSDMDGLVFLLLQVTRKDLWLHLTQSSSQVVQI